MTSNRLPILQDAARRAHAGVEEHARAGAEAALAAGEALAEAKALLGHGEWLPWLKAAGIPERSAQRYMLLHRAGHISVSVSDLGIAEACRLAALGLKMWPSEGKARELVARDDDGGHECYAAWYETETGFCSYGIAHFWPGETPSVVTVHKPSVPWLLGLYLDGVAAGFDRSAVNDIAVADAEASLGELRWAA